jgi:hypothetical protein
MGNMAILGENSKNFKTKGQNLMYLQNRYVELKTRMKKGQKRAERLKEKSKGIEEK